MTAESRAAAAIVPLPDPRKQPIRQVSAKAHTF